MIRVAAVDDHPLVLEGIIAGLASVAPQIEVVATGPTTDDVLARVPGRVDVVLLDLAMARPEGQSLQTDVTRWCARRTAVVICTSQEKPVPLRQAVAAGASGLCLKVDPVDRIAAVIETVAGGEMAYSGELAHALISDDDLVTRLTAREVEVLRQIAAGSTQRMVSRELEIGERAVKEYLDRAVARFRQRGIEPGNAHGLVTRARAEGHLVD